MLTGVIVVVMFAAIATGGEVRLAEQSPSFTRAPTPNEPVTAPPTDPVETREADPREPLRLAPFVEAIAQALYIACLSALAIIVLVFAWRHRPNLRLRRLRPPPAHDFDALDDLAAVITADAAAQRSALQRGTPRNAIVECWLRFESAVADAGIPRDPSDTSAEFTQRVVAAVSVDHGAISDLAALYREARFSNHEMNEASRRRAAEALDAVHDGLRSGPRVIETSR